MRGSDPRSHFASQAIPVLIYNDCYQESSGRRLIEFRVGRTDVWERAFRGMEMPVR